MNSHIILSGSEASDLAILRIVGLRCFAPAQYDMPNTG
jgi:hypothetical protein